MREKISELMAEVSQFSAKDKNELEQFRIAYLGKKGKLNDLFALFKTVVPEQRKEMGVLLNELKNAIQDKIDTYKDEFDQVSVSIDPKMDITRPVEMMELGSRHPLMIIRKEIIDIFSRIGFTVAEGPEIEDDWHNFSALNFPQEHPARDMQDTFFIEQNPDIALRTHTSSVQVRIMETTEPPIRILMPGRVYRNEAISARAHCFFHQVEGLYIDKDVSFADLKQALLYFAKEMFGDHTQIRLRPSYFPFTEPSAEMDISCNLCGGEGCAFCKHTGWVEILGCGMVDPNVFEVVGYDAEKYTGFAFGLGVERLTMLRYGIDNIRLFFENDLRFLSQF